MKANLNLKQFSNFLASIWNSENYKAWGESYDALWQGIAKEEFSRTLNEGYAYCESDLRFTPNGGRRWVYATTSGTRIVVQQSCWLDKDGNLTEPQIEVEIPRENGSHASILKDMIEEATS